MFIFPSIPLAIKRPPNYMLGETNAEIQVNTIKDNSNIAVAMTQQSRYSIDIFSQNMDEKIFNNKEMEKAILVLAKRHPSTKIRILTQDSSQAVKSGHCFIRLAQSLTSSVFIHNPPKEYHDEKCSFMVADKKGLMFRVAVTDRNHTTNVNFMSPNRALKLTEFFNEVWDYSTPDVQTRRMSI